MLTHCNKNQLLIVMSAIQRLKPCDENPLFNNTVEINFVNHALININWMFIIVMSTIQRSASFITYIISYCSFKRDAIDPCDENPLFITQWSDITQNPELCYNWRHQWGVSVSNARPYMMYLNRHFQKKKKNPDAFLQRHDLFCTFPCATCTNFEMTHWWDWDA